MKNILIIALTATLIGWAALSSPAASRKDIPQSDRLPPMRGLFMWMSAWNNIDSSQPSIASDRVEFEIYPKSGDERIVFVEIRWNENRTTVDEFRVITAPGIVILLSIDGDSFSSITMFPNEVDSDGWVLSTAKFNLANVGSKGKPAVSLIAWGKVTGR